MHAEPERAWTIEALARTVGMSRSAFGSRFAALRTQEIATRVGYATVAAFSRTFKRLMGQAPPAFRRRLAA